MDLFLLECLCNFFERFYSFKLLVDIASKTLSSRLIKSRFPRYEQVALGQECIVPFLFMKRPLSFVFVIFPSDLFRIITVSIITEPLYENSRYYIEKIVWYLINSYAPSYKGGLKRKKVKEKVRDISLLQSQKNCSFMHGYFNLYTPACGLELKKLTLIK
jgi:hypothetical protein